MLESELELELKLSYSTTGDHSSTLYPTDPNPLKNSSSSLHVIDITKSFTEDHKPCLNYKLAYEINSPQK